MCYTDPHDLQRLTASWCRRMARRHQDLEFTVYGEFRMTIDGEVITVAETHTYTSQGVRALGSGFVKWRDFTPSTFAKWKREVANAINRLRQAC